MSDRPITGARPGTMAKGPLPRAPTGMGGRVGLYSVLFDLRQSFRVFAFRNSGARHHGPGWHGYATGNDLFTVRRSFLSETLFFFAVIASFIGHNNPVQFSKDSRPLLILLS
jgi:hypothetical protein